MPAEPTLQNWRHYPPPGGWSVVYQPHDRPQSAPLQAQGNSPQEVLDHIRRWRANNGLPTLDAAVFDYCNTIWCLRAPDRCTHATPPPADPPAGAGRRTLTLVVQNASDRPIQVGSHYHFAETNAGLRFDREAAHGMRLNIASGTAVRFEPGQQRTVELVDLSGERQVFGFRGLVNGAVDQDVADKGHK